MSINTDKDITITGANLNADDEITLSSKDGNVYIKHGTNTIDADSTLKQANLAISLTMQNEYAQIVPATIALMQSIKQLNSVKKSMINLKVSYQAK
ncbi:hypothetical protein [Campylobacter californiensis]|uniref:hypothetical protein n=1 Tax=Campylobacter californiensis TaxID=1032243 RepID=UPI001474625F|nr:hypothetical protein [Campylobacter sp. RM12916]